MTNKLMFSKKVALLICMYKVCFWFFGVVELDMFLYFVIVAFSVCKEEKEGQISTASNEDLIFEGGFPGRSKGKHVPSMGMRRSTRLCGTRVLRSGRRIRTQPHDGGKNIASSTRENKTHEFPHTSVGGGDIDDCVKELEIIGETKTEERERESLERKCEIVYKRKRKMTEDGAEEREPDSIDRESVERKCGVVYKRKRTEDGRYGKKYVRKLWRTQCRAVESYQYWRGCVWECVETQEVAVGVSEFSYDCYHWITCFLTLLLSYMTKVRHELSAFMLSKPIFDAYTSDGMVFHQGIPITGDKPCVCTVTGSVSVMPLFSVNIFAIPPFFEYMQTSMCLRSAYLDCLHSENDDEMRNVAVDQAVSETSHINLEVSDSDTSSGGRKLRQAAKSLRTSLSINSHRIHNRRSLRRRRGTLPPSLQFGAASPSSGRRRSKTNVEDLESTMSVAADDTNVSNCSANLLITDIGKCYRVEGATISLESSSSNKWFLNVSKGETKYYSLIAKNRMRACSKNCFTSAVVWSVDQSMVFEFPDKQDWLVFKELYKECSDKNMSTHAASIIPVPVVRELPVPVDQHLPFVRSDSYITWKGDDLTKALMNSDNYDMDNEDEEWLANLNDELNVGVTPEKFELVIDALEKGVCGNPGQQLDEQNACDICMHLERKEVIEAVYKYWLRKRKRKGSSFLKVFELYQPRIQVIPTSFSGKKPTSKKEARRIEREIAAAAKLDALEHERNVHRLQEAKADVDRKVRVATLKREGAQIILQNADLKAYHATMALKIAEAAQRDEDP